MWRLDIAFFQLHAISTKPSRSHAKGENKALVSAIRPQHSWQYVETAENMAALNVDYITWIITVLGAINSNLTFIFDLNYFLWKLKPWKRQWVSSLLETKHKIFQFKTKKIPRIMSVQDAKSSLKILVANGQLSVALATGWS